MFYDEEYDEPRRDTAIFILHNLLYMHPKDIRITEAKMSLNHLSGILWIHGDKNFIRNVFIQAAKVADDSVQLMPFTPAVARPRKKYIESILTKLRAKAELDTVKTQVRPGTNDFKVFIKTKNVGVFGRYEEVNLKKIDPYDYAPKFGENTEDNENVQEATRNAKDELEATNKADMDGFQIPGRKRGRNSNENLIRKRLKSTFEEDEEKVVDNLLDFLNLNRRIEEV